MVLFKLVEVLLFGLQEVFILIDFLMNHWSCAGKAGMFSFFEVFEVRFQ